MRPPLVVDRVAADGSVCICDKPSILPPSALRSACVVTLYRSPYFSCIHAPDPDGRPDPCACPCLYESTVDRYVKYRSGTPGLTVNVLHQSGECPVLSCLVFFFLIHTATPEISLLPPHHPLQP